MKQETALRQQHHRQENSQQRIKRVFVPNAMKLCATGVEKERGVVENVGKFGLRPAGVRVIAFLQAMPQQHG